MTPHHGTVVGGYEHAAGSQRLFEPVNGSAYVCLCPVVEDVGGDDEVEVIGEADRLQSLVNRLLTPSRLPTYRRTNIHEILVRVRSVVQAEFPAITMQLDFDISIPEFEADPEQLTQAVLNIVKNAAQAVAAADRHPRDPRSRRASRAA